MGWWGSEIMAGDTPLDEQGRLMDILGCHEEGGEHYFEFEPEKFERLAITNGIANGHRRHRLLEWNRNCLNRVDDDWDAAIALMVVGWFVLEHNLLARVRGTIGEPDIRELLLNAIVGAQHDEIEGWNEPDERKEHTDRFISCCQSALSFKPYKLKHDDGLMASIAAKLGESTG